MPLSALIPEEIALAVHIPQTHMRMSTAAIFLIVPLRHKRGQVAILEADLFDTRFKKQRTIRRPQRITIAHIDLIHTWTMFAVVALNLYTILTHQTHDLADQMIISCRMTDHITISAWIQR